MRNIAVEKHFLICYLSCKTGIWVCRVPAVVTALKIDPNASFTEKCALWAFYHLLFAEKGLHDRGTGALTEVCVC